MTRKYQVTVEFMYKNGQTGGKLQKTVNGSKAAEIELNNNLNWLKAKGHTQTKIDIIEIK